MGIDVYLGDHIQEFIMRIDFKCPKTGAYIRQDHGEGPVKITGKIAKVRSATSSLGTVVEDGTGMLHPGDILHYNRGQQSKVQAGFFVHKCDFFASERSGIATPLPDMSMEPSRPGVFASFHEMKGFTDEEAASVSPLHHLVIRPERMGDGETLLNIPASLGSYTPRDSYDGLRRPLSGVVLAVPSHPIDENGMPFTGRVPAVGDRVWFSTLAWAGGTTTNDPYSKSGGLLTRWPGLMGVSDIHLGMAPSGDVYAVGPNGIAVEVEEPGSVVTGRAAVGIGKFLRGGDAWEAVHGKVQEGSWVSFRVTQGVNGDNTIAPAPWGWCIKIAARNLTGVGGPCDWKAHERRVR